MSSWRVGRFVGILAVAVLVSAAAVPVAASAASGSFDLGVGWVRQLDEPMPIGTTIAGDAESGFVARGFDAGYWSADGLQWQEVAEFAGPLAIRALVANGNGFVGTRERAPVTSVLFSPDGRSWDEVEVGAPGAFYVEAMAGPGGFLVVGQESDCDVAVRFSSDGRSWQPVEIPVGCTNFMAAPVGDGWIALGGDDGEVIVLSSDDGIEWNDIDASMPPPSIPNVSEYRLGLQDLLGIGSLSSNGTALVLSGSETDGMWVSVDEADTWEKSATDPGRVEMTVSDFGFVGVSEGQVLHSADGISWDEYPVNTDFHDIAAAGDSLVALANDGIYTWTPNSASLAQTGAPTPQLIAVALALIVAGFATLRVQGHRKPHLEY